LLLPADRIGCYDGADEGEKPDENRARPESAAAFANLLNGDLELMVSGQTAGVDMEEFESVADQVRSFIRIRRSDQALALLGLRLVHPRDDRGDERDQRYA